ncbi:hypothetical protein HDU67_007824 [Dinochytrium kinnereticum]|nr:hypothetical protein HDU67_007824 [Dinochytrium kinnereticum]
MQPLNHNLFLPSSSLVVALGLPPFANSEPVAVASVSGKFFARHPRRGVESVGDWNFEKRALGDSEGFVRKAKGFGFTAQSITSADEGFTSSGSSSPQPRAPRKVWSASKIAAQRKVAAEAKAQKLKQSRGLRRDNRVNRKLGAKNRKAERTALYNGRVKTNQQIREAGKGTNESIRDWINTGVTPGKATAGSTLPEDVDERRRHRYQVIPATADTVMTVKVWFPGSQAVPVGPPGVAKLNIIGGGKIHTKGRKRGTAADQVKSVFLKSGDYQSTGITGLPNTVSETDGYSTKKANFMNRQAFLKGVADGAGVHPVAQPDGASTIQMQVYPPTATGVGTAYPVGR